MSLRKAHSVHVRNTMDALKAEISMPLEIGLPITACIDFTNIEFTARKARWFVEYPCNQDAAKALRLISEMRDALDSAERAIKWGKPE